MKCLSIFFGAALLFVGVFLSLKSASAQTLSCTYGSEAGTCVAGSSDCAGGTTRSGTECSGNTERTLCCISSSGNSHEGATCTSPGGQSGTCHDGGSCPGSTPIGTASSVCSSYGLDYCCVAHVDTDSGSTASCSDASSHCKSSCSSYGGTKSGCSGVCSNSSYSYCVRTTTSVTTGSGTSDTSGGWTSGFERVQTESGLSQKTIPTLVSNFMKWLLYLFGFLSIIGFAIAGTLYLTSAGDEKQLGTAKTAAKWSIMGVIVALMGYVIIKAADAWLGGGTDF